MVVVVVVGWLAVVTTGATVMTVAVPVSAVARVVLRRRGRDVVVVMTGGMVLNRLGFVVPVTRAVVVGAC